LDAPAKVITERRYFAPESKMFIARYELTVLLLRSDKFRSKWRLRSAILFFNKGYKHLAPAGAKLNVFQAPSRREDVLLQRSKMFIARNKLNIFAP
jgi:hypothetical protein